MANIILTDYETGSEICVEARNITFYKRVNKMSVGETIRCMQKGMTPDNYPHTLVRTTDGFSFIVSEPPELIREMIVENKIEIRYEGNEGIANSIHGVSKSIDNYTRAYVRQKEEDRITRNMSKDLFTYKKI